MKTTTTEKYYTNCPNCGGAIGPSDKFCTYCGTRVVYERSVTQEDTMSWDSNRVDIESEATEGDGGAGGVFRIAFFAFWCVLVFCFTGTFFATGGIMGLVPLAMLCFGVMMLVKQIKAYKNHNEVLAGAPRYSATVLDHCVYTETRGTDDNKHTVTLAKVKVLADINGQKKTILIKVGDPTNAAKYPEGSKVTIAGRDNYFVIV